MPEQQTLPLPQLPSLILQNSPEIPTLRSRAISGNQQYLHQFCTAINTLLKNPQYHQHAYREINQLILSARPQVVGEVGQSCMGEVRGSFVREELGGFLGLWRRIGESDGRYGVLVEKLRGVRLRDQGKKRTEEFENFFRRFKKNMNEQFDNRVQFFSDSSANSLTQSFPNYETEQASSQVIESELKKLQQIRNSVENQRVTKQNAQEYYKSVRRFLSLKPKSMGKELNLDFNNDRIWAKEFVQNYHNLKKSQSLTVHRYTGMSRTQLSTPEVSPYASPKRNTDIHANTYTYGTVKNNNQSPSFKKGSRFQNSNQPFSFQIQRNQEEERVKREEAMRPISPNNRFGGTYPNNRFTFQPNFILQETPTNIQQRQPLTQPAIQPQPQQQQPRQQYQQYQQQTSPQTSSQMNLQIYSKPASQQPSQPQQPQQLQPRTQYSTTPSAYNMQTYQSQTIPYNPANFSPPPPSPSPQPQQQYNTPQSLQQIRPLIASQSSENFHGSRRQRPKIFNSRGIQEPAEELLDVIIHGREGMGGRGGREREGRERGGRDLRWDANSNNMTTISQDIAGRGNMGMGYQRMGRDDLDYKSDGFVQIPYSPSPRWTFLSDGTPYSSSDNQNINPGMRSSRSPWNKNIVVFPNSLHSQKYYQPHSNSQGNQMYTSPQYKSPSKYKLSQYSQQKKHRITTLTNQQYLHLETYIIEPYIRSFAGDRAAFSQWKRNCLRNSGILYESSGLFVEWTAVRVGDCKVEVEIVYERKGEGDGLGDLGMYTLYRVPKCMKYWKQGEIRRNWLLRDTAVHRFDLDLVSFPIEPCFLNLKYGPNLKQENFHHTAPTVIMLPLTLRNYLDFLVINQPEYKQKWSQWKQNNNFHISRNLLLDKQTLNNEPVLTPILPQFTPLTATPKFSTQQLGAHIYQKNMNNLEYLIKISQRIQSILTIELLANRRVQDADQGDFLGYCVDVWGLLIGRSQGYGGM